MALFNIQERHLVRGGSARLERREALDPRLDRIQVSLAPGRSGKREGERERGRKEYCGKMKSERYDELGKKKKNKR